MEGLAMNKPALPRLAAACGVIFAVGLTAANGSGNQPFWGVRAIAGIAALTLILPFFGYLCSLLRQAEGADGWLANTALAAGITFLALKLGSGAPELAKHTGHLASGTQLATSIDGIANGATLLSLYPLAVFCAATAIVAFRTRVLPRWLSAGAAITAAALAINGGFLSTDSVPAMLLFVLWTLLTSVLFLRWSWRRPARAIHEEAKAAAGA
jgi:hypothetical protein